jgi:enoyl-CoA hydratase
MDYTRIRVDAPLPGVSRITLARPEIGNSQDMRMLYEIDRALSAAGLDDSVRVVIVAGDGDDFSIGHDPGQDLGVYEDELVTQQGGFGLPGAEGWMAMEEDAYIGLCWRWRNFPKPTVAQVHGRVIAGGLMLVWPWDLIIASDDALFGDPCGSIGINGHEFFVHPSELGPRKAKELLFTSDVITAEEGWRLGMINHVVPRADLETFTFDLATKIAARPSFALKLSKKSVNVALEAQGQWTALQHAFALHQLAHAHWRLCFGGAPGAVVDPSGFEIVPDVVKDAWKPVLNGPIAIDEPHLVSNADRA